MSIQVIVEPLKNEAICPFEQLTVHPETTDDWEMVVRDLSASSN